MNKKSYQSPVIIKHQNGLANKFGRSRNTRTISEIDGHLIEDMVEKYGSPLFVFSEKRIRENYRNAYKSFSVRYPNILFAWSYKTNYLDAVCRIFHDEGSIAEVVSEYEYEMAKRNGIPGHKIIYNGPYKPDPSLKKAIDEGAMVHADHYDELSSIEAIAEEKGEKVDIGIRLNMDTGIYPQWDRFGFNYDNGEAMSAARRIAAGKRINIKGVHAHIGTFVLEPNAYAIEVEKLISFSSAMEKELGFEIEYIDLGGGFPSQSTLHNQYCIGEDSNPPIDSYAEAITNVLLKYNFKNNSFPKLILETGRALIDSAGLMVTSVVANKRLANGTRATIVDAGVNTLFTSFWYKHQIYPVKHTSGMFEETIIYGPLCMNIDVIRSSIRLPAMNKGDLMVIAPVGAYNVTQWLQFIRMRPNIVMTGISGEISCIRKNETIDAIKDHEHVPEWINRNGI